MTPSIDGDVRARARRARTAARSCPRRQHRVQVAGRAPGGQRVVAGVDVVRARPCARETASPRARSAAISPVATVVLPCPDAGRGDDEPRDVHHSMPRWPFWPASIGCLILVISHHEIGRLDQPRVGVAAGDDDVLMAGAVPQGGDDVVDVDPAPLHRVGELVQHVEAVRLRGEVALDLLPALPGVGGVVGLGAGPLDPRPALAHLVPGRPGRPRRSARAPGPGRAARSPRRPSTWRS